MSKSKKWEVLSKKLEAAERKQEEAQEVVVGALRGLMETASYNDREAFDILKQFENHGDEAMRDALSLFFDKLDAFHKLQQEARETISRGDLV